ncbi:MAG: sigma-54-dependent Fis family transcriptional regulator [Planctomycetes bacterium]|jgi:transcriptional regulator of acetoin/glycerol metabolism|nr:sigma-54-dependent Fis family transcriptional regulator [Planctomycetota bacterium]
MQLPAPEPDRRLLAARRQLLAGGALPAGLLAPTIERSWQRCRDGGLVPDAAPRDGSVRHGATLRAALEQHGEFLAQARPVLAFVHEQIRDSGDLVLLADHDGLLLHAIGEPSFVARAERVALMPGACWSESQRGTNAIGTALAEAAAVVVHAGEHFLDANGFLTCTAAPIIDSTGALRGVIDISGDRAGRHPHTLALVRTAARMIEERLFAAMHGRHARLLLHPTLEGLDTMAAGLLALTEDGWIVGANAAARGWLRLAARDLGACTVASVLGLAVDDVMRSAGRHRRLALADHRAFWTRLELPAGTGHGIRATSTQPSASATTPADLDPQVAAARRRAQRALAAGLPLLLLGESGTGKEVFARELHEAGPRRTGPLVAVDCTAMPESLIEAELFGYAGGAFTGARREGARGRCREANGGTLLLDEIGDMPLSMQSRLLRVLEERRVRPVGSSESQPIDVHLIAATHRDLHAAVANGTFRADLFHRLNGLSVTLPALRDRIDFANVCDRMLAQVRPEAPPSLAPELAVVLRAFAWPGNLRQLRNVLTAAAAMLEPGDVTITFEHLPDDLRRQLRDGKGQRPAARDSDNLRQLSARTIDEVIAATGHNLSAAARRLGISRNTLYRHLRARAPGADD